LNESPDASELGATPDGTSPSTGEPAGPPDGPPPGAEAPPPAVHSTRRLLGASFDLLTQSATDMRRASFYVGAIVLGTMGPFALATLAIEVATREGTGFAFEDLSGTGAGFWYSLLGLIAALGLIVAGVESRNMAVALLGGRYAGRRIDVDAALARSRMSFWRAIVAAIIVTMPVSFATTIIDNAVVEVSRGSTGASLVVAFVVGVLVGAPLAYLLTGIILGDVGPLEAVRRSLRVFGVRRTAAALVAAFESIAVLLVLVGFGAGLEIVFMVFSALGLGTDSGPAGLALLAAGIIVGVFAFGTLIYTALAISVAPQVVMFVGLTRATMGLDHVRPSGDHDPAFRRPGQRRFRWLTIPMRLAFGLAFVAYLGVLASIPG
jgi:hypothetical protein